MARFLTTSITAALALLLVPAASTAHEIVVLPVGSATIDAGTGAIDRLVHATLDQPGDELVVTAVATGTPIDVLLLLPDRAPERGLRSSDQPRVSIFPGSASTRTLDPGSSADTIVDEATAVAYRTLDAHTIAAPNGDVRIVVRRGGAPTRIAVRIASPTAAFEAANIDRTPRALLNLRAWAETPAPSSDYDPPAPRTKSRSFVAWYGAGIASLGVAIGVWWVWSGRRRSRERGVERAEAERESEA